MVGLFSDITAISLNEQGWEEELPFPNSIPSGFHETRLFFLLTSIFTARQNDPVS